VQPDAPLARILLVEDDTALADVVGRYLTAEGFDVLFATDGQSGLDLALQALPDLVVLDVMLPRLDGIEVCRRIREVAPIAVVMLTARGEEEDRIAGLRMGADDYVTKPFSPGELVARIHAVLRRTLQRVERPEPLVAGSLRVDRRAHEAWLDGQSLQLTSKEFDLLAHLMAHPRKTFARDELLSSVWGWSFGDTATVTVHVRRLREKIEQDPSAPRHVMTVRGAGYRFDP
jgi:DNA-binding response OmpR family regulator